MANFNKVILAGNITRDPELRYTPKGTAVCKLGLAINRKWRDDAGQDKEEVVFVDCDAFGKTAETISQYLKRGRPVLVEGRLKLETWEDKTTGKQRSKLGVVLESFQFLGDKQSDDTPEEPRAATARQGLGEARKAVEAAAPGKAVQPALAGTVDDDDGVPF